jgi:hypothetical protein
MRPIWITGLYPLEWGGTQGDEIDGGERERGYRPDGTQQWKPAASLRWRAGARPTLARLRCGTKAARAAAACYEQMIDLQQCDTCGKVQLSACLRRPYPRSLYVLVLLPSRS